MKKIVFFVSIVIFLFIINNFYHSIYSLWQKQDLIVSARKELAHEKQQQGMLKRKLETVQNPAYLEEEARNKLFLVKPGEKIVVLPQITDTPEKNTTDVKEPDPVWLQWYSLFN